MHGAISGTDHVPAPAVSTAGAQINMTGPSVPASIPHTHAGVAENVTSASADPAKALMTPAITSHPFQLPAQVQQGNMPAANMPAAMPMPMVPELGYAPVYAAPWGLAQMPVPAGENLEVKLCWSLLILFYTRVGFLCVQLHPVSLDA
jgi:hypothetical protein